jgi:hypothetical protein
VQVVPRAGPLERVGIRALLPEQIWIRVVPLELVWFRVLPLAPAQLRVVPLELVWIRVVPLAPAQLLGVPPELVWFRAVPLEWVARQAVLQAQFVHQVARRCFAAYWEAFHEQAWVAQHGPRAVPLALAHQDERWKLVG